MSQCLLRCGSKKTVRSTVCATASLRIPGIRGCTVRTISSSGVLSTPSWATADPNAMGVDQTPHAVKNLVDGNWSKEGSTAETISIPHPLDVGSPPIFTIPDTQISELGPFFESLRKVKKSGLHNPLKNPERYVQYGEISRKVSSLNVACSFNQFVRPKKYFSFLIFLFAFGSYRFWTVPG